MSTLQTKGVNSAKLVTGMADAFRYFPIANGYATAIAEGDLVKIVSGTIQVAANGDNIVGVFRGVEYIDPTTKKPVMQPNYVAGTTVTEAMNGETRPMARVELVADKTFVMRTASMAIANTAIGNIYPVTGQSTPDSTGHSQAVIDATTPVAAAAGMVQVVGLYREPGNDWGVGPTAVEVIFVNKTLI